MEKRKRSRERLIDFVKYTNPNYRAASIHYAIAERLDAVARGEITRLMIMTPPRHGKSELVSRRFPAFYLGRNPRRQFISASYGSDLAANFGRDVRNLIAAPEFRVLFPRVTLAADSQSKDKWHTNHGGNYLAAGVGSAITGYGADILNIDDPVKDRAEAESETIRNAVWDWYTAVAYTRLMPGGSIVLTMTRWHEDDLCGRLLNAEESGGDKWEKLVFPAIGDDGAALWEEAYPRPALDQIRAAIGERDWVSLYEQRPRPPGGSFFSLDDLLIEGAPAAYPEKCDSVFAILDTATKTGTTNDGTAVLYCAYDRFRHGYAIQTTNFGGKRPENEIPLHWLDWDLVQIEGAVLEDWLPSVFVRLNELAKLTNARLGSIGAFIEDKASGMILLQQAARKGLPAQPIESELTSLGKVERAINASPYITRGLVKFTQPAYDRVVTYKGTTKNHLLSQILSFHVGTKDMAADDLLDTATYSVALALGNIEGF